MSNDCSGPAAKKESPLQKRSKKVRCKRRQARSEKGEKVSHGATPIQIIRRPIITEKGLA